MFHGALQAIYTMIKAKVELSGLEGQKFAKWETVNIYKIIAKIMNMLNYANVMKDAIVDLRKQKISYQSMFIRMLGYFAIRSGGQHRSFHSLSQSLMNPFDDQCLYLNLLIYLRPYLSTDEIPLALSPEDFRDTFDRLLNPLFSWLRYLEQVKAPVLVDFNQSGGAREQTQLEKMWRALLTERVKMDRLGEEAVNSIIREAERLNRGD